MGLIEEIIESTGPRINSSARFNSLKDWNTMLKKGPLPSVPILEYSIPEVIEREEGIVMIKGMQIDPGMLKYGNAGKNIRSYKATELDVFLKSLGIRITGLKKNQKVDAIILEIKNLYPNIQINPN